MEIANSESGFQFIYRTHADFDNVKPGDMAQFFKQNWHVSLYYSAVYLVLIYYGHRWMATRPKPFDLRLPLAVWSGSLAAFSIAGSIGVWPEFLRTLRDRGLVATYCESSYLNDKMVSYWFMMFGLSKVPELFDTAFIVLRKQKLIPLHWIHHVLTLVYCFYSGMESPGCLRWMAAMNLLVHSLMYSYYCLKALRFRIPRPIALSITLLQISQMFVGLAIHSHILLMHYRGTASCDCPDSPVNVSLPGLLMYLLYFYFFIKFFVDVYLQKRLTMSSAAATTNNKKIDNNNSQSNQRNGHNKVE